MRDELGACIKKDTALVVLGFGEHANINSCMESL